MKQATTMIGATFTSIAASACCILPAVLGVASAGSLGFGATLAPYRPYFMGLTVILLSTAFYFTYRPSKAEDCDTGSCPTDDKAARIKRFSKVMLWVVTLFTIGAMAYPSIAAYRAERQADSATPMQSVAADAATETAVFAVGKMTCAECSLQIASALKKTPGVQDAKVDFETKRAVVRYDAAQVGVPKLRNVIESTGYTATEAREE